MPHFYLLLVIHLCLAATISLDANKDAMIIRLKVDSCGTLPCADTNYGTATDFMIGSNQIRLISNVLVGFSLADIPVDATITSAQLFMPFAEISGNYFSPYTVFRVTSSWDENTVTWNTQPTNDATAVGELYASLKNPPDPVDVTAAVQQSLANRQVSFKLVSQNGYTYFFKSREAGFPGRLLVTYTMTCSAAKIAQCATRPRRDECCYNSQTNRAECYNPNNENCAVNPQTGATALCPGRNGQICVTATGAQCFRPVNSVCAGPNTNNQYVLCPRNRPQVCGSECYNPNRFICNNGVLQRK